ncbi:MAG: exo-alpha-sialidase, partial [Planctomycetes bacterium]|nr:exo-alpha-sialidase [Planctomycetota bacterium]
MLYLGSFVAVVLLVHAAPEPPRMLFQGGNAAGSGVASAVRVRYAIMRMPDGSFAFYDRYKPQASPLVLPDGEGRKHTFLPPLARELVESEAIIESGVLANTQVILTPGGEVKSVYVKGEKLDREAALRVGLPRYLDVWIKQASRTDASEPKMIWRGYNGSQMEYEQLPGGRIIVPYGSFQPHAKAIPPTGRHKTIIQYSDDDGRTWKESVSKLTSPCYAGFNGSNEGACEPAIEPLRDGRIWMLMRTQAGFLYESY